MFWHLGGNVPNSQGNHRKADNQQNSVNHKVRLHLRARGALQKQCRKRLMKNEHPLQGEREGQWTPWLTFARSQDSPSFQHLAPDSRCLTPSWGSGTKVLGASTSRTQRPKFVGHRKKTSARMSTCSRVPWRPPTEVRSTRTLWCCELRMP